MKISQFILGPISTNSYVVWDEGSRDCFIVDPADFPDEMFVLIESEGLYPTDIVLTHAHGDHIGGIPALMESFPDIRVSVGAEDAHLLSEPEKNLAQQLSGHRVCIDKVNLLHDGDVLTVGDMKLRIIATPGHTPGCICIYTGGTLFSGDTLFRASIGRTDLPGGDYDSIVASIRNKLFKLPNAVPVYPGHMDATSIEYEKRYNPYV